MVRVQGVEVFNVMKEVVRGFRYEDIKDVWTFSWGCRPICWIGWRVNLALFRVDDTKESITSWIAGSTAPVRVFGINISADDEFVA